MLNTLAKFQNNQIKTRDSIVITKEREQRDGRTNVMGTTIIRLFGASSDITETINLGCIECH